MMLNRCSMHTGRQFLQIGLDRTRGNTPSLGTLLKRTVLRIYTDLETAQMRHLGLMGEQHLRVQCTGNVECAVAGLLHWRGFMCSIVSAMFLL